MTVLPSIQNKQVANSLTLNSNKHYLLYPVLTPPIGKELNLLLEYNEYVLLYAH